MANGRVTLPKEIQRLSIRALGDLVLHVRGFHPSPTLTRPQIYDLLRYKGSDRNNPINQMRDRILAFIEDRADALALPCHGRCYEHSDAIVVACDLELRTDTIITIDLDDLDT